MNTDGERQACSTGWLTSPDLLRRQAYSTPAAHDTRVSLYERFFVGQRTWRDTLWDALELREGSTVLDLGCGSGELWLRVNTRGPRPRRLVLVDLSPGMLEACRGRLGEPDYAVWVQADLNAGVPAGLVGERALACHMLYHLRAVPLFIRSVHAALEPGGLALFTTVGDEHLASLRALVSSIHGEAIEDMLPTAEQMLIELAQVFPELERVEYREQLHVTEVGPLVEYVLSSRVLHRDKLGSADARAALVHALAQWLERDGVICLPVHNVIARAGRGRATT